MLKLRIDPGCRVGICVPLRIMVFSKTCWTSKYTISKTIPWSQSWICLEVKDLDFMFLEISQKPMIWTSIFLKIFQKKRIWTSRFLKIFQKSRICTPYFEIISKIPDLDSIFLKLFQKSRIWTSKCMIFEIWRPTTGKSTKMVISLAPERFQK